MSRYAAPLPAFLWLASLAVAAEWGGIEPGVTTLEQVRDRYGAPTGEKRATLEGYDTREWVYEGSKAPAGIIRMVVEYGLLTPGGYQPSRVRLFRLEPKPAIFGRETIMQGWGAPDLAGTEKDRMTFFYKSGLLVTFGTDGASATSMYFMLPQPDPPAAGPESAEPRPGQNPPSAPPAPRR